MRLRCVLLLLALACATGRTVPPSVRGLTVLIQWPATVSGAPPSRNVDDLAAALPEEIARVLVSEGLSVVRIAADPHDVVASASVALEPDPRVDPFTTRPIKNRFRGQVRLNYVCGDGTAGYVQFDVRDEQIEFIASDVGGPLARGMVRSRKIFEYATRRGAP